MPWPWTTRQQRPSDSGTWKPPSIRHWRWRAAKNPPPSTTETPNSVIYLPPAWQESKKISVVEEKKQKSFNAWAWRCPLCLHGELDPRHEHWEENGGLCRLADAGGNTVCDHAMHTECATSLLRLQANQRAEQKRRYRKLYRELGSTCPPPSWWGLDVPFEQKCLQCFTAFSTTVPFWNGREGGTDSAAPSSPSVSLPSAARVVAANVAGSSTAPVHAGALRLPLFNLRRAD